MLEGGGLRGTARVEGVQYGTELGRGRVRHGADAARAADRVQG